MENGSAMLGITVAEALRRNRKITRITRPMVSNMVNLISSKASRIFLERSLRIFNSTDGGSWDLKNGSSRLIESFTSMVLLPG